MTTSSDIDATIFRGANAKFFGRKTLDDNPYPPSPGYYALHRAWRYGFLYWEEVLDRHDASPLKGSALRRVATG